MSLVYLTPNKRLIRANGVDSTNNQNTKYELLDLKFDLNGSLVEFSVGFNNQSNNNESTFIYVNRSHYLYDYQKKEGKTGYLKKSYFVKLKNNPSETYKIINLPENSTDLWFDDHFEDAKLGDDFVINRVIFDENLEVDYYTILDQTFRLNDKTIKINFANSSEYPKIKDEALNSLNYNIYETKSRDRRDIEEGNFFKANFSAIKNSTTIQENSKQVLYSQLIQICFAIYWIRKEVLDILAIKPLTEIENAVIAGTLNEKNSQNEYKFPLIDRIIGQLLTDWGYKDIQSTRILAVEPPDNDYFYEGYYTTFSNYSNALDNFYHNLREKIEQGLFPSNTTNEGDWQSNARIKVLKDLLPPSAISLLPYRIRENIIEEYINREIQYKLGRTKIDYGDPRIPNLQLPGEDDGSFSNHDQENCLAIMYSFYINVDDRKSFLQYLLKLRDGKNTNFDVLMNMFSAARVMRIAPVIGFFLRQKNYRMNYVFMVYKIWKKSEYNFFYYPNLNDIDNGMINIDSYFFKEGFKYFDYNDKKVSNYTVYIGTIWKSPVTTDVNDVVTSAYTKRLYTKTVPDGIMIKTTFTDYLYENKTRPGEDTVTTVQQQNVFPKELKFHLYQPIALCGYKVDPEMVERFPPLHQVPAFLWYYSNDYEVIKEFDSKYNLALGVTFDVGLFFITGGLGDIIASFRHLRYLTLFGRAIRATEGAGAVYTAFILEGLGATAEVVTISSMVCTRYYDFMKENAKTDLEAKKYEELNKMFFYITLLAAGASLSFRALAVRQAGLVRQASYFSSLPIEVKDAVSSIAGIITKELVAFRNSKINNLDKITAKYDTVWTDVQKNWFFEDFSRYTEADLKLFNKDEVLDRWLLLKKESIVDRKIIDVVSSQTKTNAIINYYKEYRIRQTLSVLKSEERWMFLDGFGKSDEIISYIKNDHTIVERWTKLNAQGKAFSVNNPEKWLYRFDRLYENLKKANRLSDAEIVQRYGQRGLDLVNEVEAFALQHISITNEKLFEKHILISGMKDKTTGVTSSFFHNFSGYDFNKGGAFDLFINGPVDNPNTIFPNLKRRIDEVWAFDKKNYNMSDSRFLNNTGKYPGAHAEVRALDDLAKKKFPNYLTSPPSDEVFNAWLKNDVLGYNRNIQHGVGQQNVIMHTCADCFHILDLVTFVRP